jgi:hypothetical protein
MPGKRRLRSSNQGKGKGKVRGQTSTSSTSPPTGIVFDKLLIFKISDPVSEENYSPLVFVPWTDVQSVVKEDYMVKQLVLRRRMKTFHENIHGKYTSFRILSKVDSRISDRDLDKVKFIIRREITNIIRHGAWLGKDVFDYLLPLVNSRQILGMSKLIKL